MPELSVATLLAIIAILAIIVALAVVLWSILDRRVHTRQLESARRDLRETSRRLRRVEAEQRFTTRFLREFPDLTRELTNQKRFRDVPAVLVKVLEQIFRAEKAIVVLRSEIEGEEALVIAAAFPEDEKMHPGMRIPISEGELGFVAQTQRVMDRADIAAEKKRSPRFEVPSVLEFTPELVAPLALHDQTYGVVAISGIHHMPSHAKEVLRMVSHVGSLTLHSVTAFMKVKSAADIDSLTGIFNKRVLTFKLGEMLFDAENRRESLAVFIFDIDHFKTYNDTNGHLAGDDLLRGLTKLVGTYVRADDIFGRFGGEEFLVILSGRTESEALVAAEKIRKVVEMYDFQHGESQPSGRLTISGGIATFPADGKTSVEILKAADDALYRAKQQGRNRVFTSSKFGPSELSSD